MTKRIALVGNPNSGKTTLFNTLTGSSQRVGNWPGVTVEKKEGKIKGNKELHLVDLPGIYSLSPYTLEEVVARDYLINEKPDLIINIVDSSNLERNLYLTSQLLELHIPMVVALNMTDIVEKRGDKIDTKKLSDELGVEVVQISALKNKGIDDLLSLLNKEKHLEVKPFVYASDVEQVISIISEEVLKHANEEEYKGLDNRWLSIKLFERDSKVLEKFSLNNDLENKILSIEDKYDDDSESIISSSRYDTINDLSKKVLVKNELKKLTTSDKIDKIVTNRWLAIPIFAIIIFIVYYVSVTTVGKFVTDFTNDNLVSDTIQPAVSDWLTGMNIATPLVGLIVDGIIGGVGAVIGFLPQMMILFLFIGLLEQSGYMARVAFILDRIFRKFGLSGKAFIPMLIGTGCSIPGIMAARTIENEKDRRMTAITTSFMPCSAKLPIIALFAGTIFGGAFWVGPICYFIGILAVIFSGIVLKKTSGFKGDPAPFIMELPEYRIPTLKGLFYSIVERVWSFAKKAGTVILLSSIVIFALSHFSIDGEEKGYTEDIEGSILSDVAGFVSPVFKPLGFGDDWKPTVAAINGLVAKENVVQTFGTLYSDLGDEAQDKVEEGDFTAVKSLTAGFNTVTGFSFLLFNLLCAPCFAAIGAMKRELGTAKWTLFGIGYQTLLAYSVAFMFNQFGSFFTGAVGFGIGQVVAIVVLAIWLFMLFRPMRRTNGISK